jgi:ABC-type multidrug transport system ATPase subunit
MQIDGLKVKYKNKTVFSSLSLSIANGEKVAVLGGSGEGKTSIIKALLSLVEFEGSITDKPKFSIVFQENRLVEELSARDNILLACPNSDADSMLEKVGLGKEKNDKVKTFSGGMKRRVAIARALCKDFDTLLLDEPFTGLDIATKGKMSELIKNQTTNKGLVLVTHDLLQAYDLCERVVIISSGVVVLDESVCEFSLQDAKNFFVNK